MSVGGTGPKRLEGVSSRASPADAEAAPVAEEQGTVRWNTSRMAGSAQMGQLAQMARILDAEPRASSAIAAFPVKVKPLEVTGGSPEQWLFTPEAIASALVSKNPDHVADAIWALKDLAQSDPRAAAAILAKLPKERALEIAAWVYERMERPWQAQWFLVHLSEKFPIPLAIEDTPELPEKQPLSPKGIEKGLAAKGYDRVVALLALRDLAETDFKAAIAILKKLPFDEGLEIASWIRGKLLGPEVGQAEAFTRALSKDPDFAKNWAAKLAKGPGAKDYDRAEALLRDLAQNDPKAAVAILRKLPIERGLEIAAKIRGQLSGSEFGAAEQFVIALSEDPDFAGRWGAELAKGLKTGGTAGTDFLPVGTKNAQEAVTRLVQQHAGDEKKLAAFTAAMWKQGGDDALAFTLSSLSEAGPTPTAVAFLRGLKGKGCNNYIARILGSKDKGESEEKAQVELAIATLLQNIPKVVGNMKDDGPRLAAQILSATEEAIGNHPAAQREFTGWLKGQKAKWADPKMVGFLRGTDEVARKTRTTRYRETREIRKELQSLRAEYEAVIKIKDRTERESRLRSLYKKFDEVNNKLDTNLKASGAKIKIPWIGKIEVGGEIDFDRDTHDRTETENESDVSTKVAEAREANLRMLDDTIRSLETYEEEHKIELDEVESELNPSRTAEDHILVVGGAINDALR